MINKASTRIYGLISSCVLVISIFITRHRFCSIRRVVPHSSEARRDHHESDATVESWSASSPPEAEVEAFLAAAELAERRRFMETYNYDIALDRPLEGRFDWSPVST